MRKNKEEEKRVRRILFKPRKIYRISKVKGKKEGEKVFILECSRRGKTG